ncbi:hypothetical protein H0O03_00860 [Candidatus Micrarchaeota archaeon]|nr:hypothetical protein [Candidatus Micrarchaeota archaeon]
MPKDYSRMTVKELEKELSEILELEGHPDELFRTAVFMGQLDFAKHIYHQKKYSPNTRFHKSGSKAGEISSFGQALVQLLLLIRTRELPLNEVLEYGVEHLKYREWNEKKAGDEKRIAGLPAGCGKATGIAYVVVDEKQLDKIPSDAVVVMEHASAHVATTHLTKFLALVTDQGGVLSHAAILARELKKPVVVGTGNATKLIKTGELVTVDAETGVVEKTAKS